jgi:hypothetical protein
MGYRSVTVTIGVLAISGWIFDAFYDLHSVTGDCYLLLTRYVVLLWWCVTDLLLPVTDDGDPLLIIVG